MLLLDEDVWNGALTCEIAKDVLHCGAVVWRFASVIVSLQYSVEEDEGAGG